MSNAQHTYTLTFKYVNEKRIFSTELTMREQAMIFNSGMLDGKVLEWAEIWDGVGLDSLHYDFNRAKAGVPAFVFVENPIEEA